MVTLPIIHAQQRRERLEAGLIISVFQSGTFKLTADDIVCLLLGFVIRGDFPAREDLIRDTARLEGLVHSLPVRWKGIVQPFAFTRRRASAQNQESTEPNGHRNSPSWLRGSTACHLPAEY